jgi:hypothetical protein
MLIAVAALGFGALSLSGCSVLQEQAHREVTSHADNRADVKSPPAWMPEDATDISSSTGTAAKNRDAAPMTVVFTSKQGVDSSDCKTVPRKSAPVMTIAGAPDVYAATTVVRCGDWSMVVEKHRWVAWTPNTGDSGS